jgi:hypothetical protein
MGSEKTTSAAGTARAISSTGMSSVCELVQQRERDAAAAVASHPIAHDSVLASMQSVSSMLGAVRAGKAAAEADAACSGRGAKIQHHLHLQCFPVLPSSSSSRPAAGAYRASFGLWRPQSQTGQHGSHQPRRTKVLWVLPAASAHAVLPDHNNSPGAEEEQASPAAEPQSAEAFTPASQLPRRLTMGDRRNSTHTVGGVGLIGRFDGAAGSTAAAVGDKDGDQEERQGQQEDNAFEPVSELGAVAPSAVAAVAAAAALGTRHR